ncbi:ABC transporter ATP-binding protein [Alkaliphilus crotonatoxidans]
MASLTLKSIFKTYSGEVIAVKDLNLEIRDKEFLVLVGPSGCGKSTTLRMIAGLEEISRGELYIDDRLVNEVAPKDRDIAMVFQNYALYPHMSVYDNMAFGLKLRKMSKEEIKRRVEEAAKILDIEEYLNRKPKALSGGQRQRVALGRAIVREPKVFLMDEPLSNLDAKLRVQMRTELAKLHKKLQTTFIYVTHDQTEAMTMGDRIVVMKEGVVQQVDSPLNLYNHPQNMFVAGFIGSPQINFIHGTLKESEDAVIFEFGQNEIKMPEDRAKILKNRGYIGRRVVLGIRPEDVHNEEDYVKEHQDTSLEATVEVTELMGAEIYLYMKLGEESITARISARSHVSSGDSIKLALDPKRIHLFDGEDETAIF